MHRSLKRISLGIFLFILFCHCAFLVFAAEEEKDYSGVTSHGVIYNIAEDRKIAKVGAVSQPEGLDIYLKRHMDELSAQIKTLESKMESMQKDIQEIHESVLGENIENTQVSKK